MSERLHGRIPLRVRVQFRSASSLLIAYSLNLSRGGIFIETAAPPDVGSRLDLELDAAQAGPITVRGHVTWRRPVADAGGPAGVGVEFDDLSDNLGAAIDRLIAEFAGVTILLFCPDLREREMLRRMLRTVVSAAEVVSPESAAMCQQLCDENIDLVVIESDDDTEAALKVVAAARRLPSPIPIVGLTSDDAVAAQLKREGDVERVGNPPPLAELSRAVIRALGRPTAIGKL